MSNAATDNVVRLKNVRTGEIADQVAQTVSTMADQLSERVQGLSSRAREAARSTDGFVRARPWQAIGLVALAGLAVGLLVSFAARESRQPDGEDNYDEMSGG